MTPKELGRETRDLIGEALSDYVLTRELTVENSVALANALALLVFLDESGAFEDAATAFLQHIEKEKKR